MKRTLISGLLASAGLSAAALTGSIFDPSGAAVPNAKILLYNPDTSVKQELTSTPDGKFAFDNLEAGQYILRIEKPGFAALLHEFTLQPESKVERGLTLQVGSIQENVRVEAKGSPKVVRESTNPVRLRVGGEIQESNLINKTPIVYPASAKAAGIQGKVMLRAVISKDGTPVDLTVLSSPSDDLSQAALDGVRQWRYSPTLLNGQPVEIATEVMVNFTLSQ
jgi:TonB family protein